MLKLKPELLIAITFVIAFILIAIGYVLTTPIPYMRIYVQEFKIQTGMLSWLFITFNLILAAKFKLMDKLIALDAMYKLHKVIGMLIFMLVILHFFAGDVGKFLASFIEFPTLSGASPQRVKPQYFAEAKLLAKIIMYVGLVVFVSAMLPKFRYKTWYYVHKSFALMYLIMLFHAIVFLNPKKLSDPFTLVVIALSIIGIISAVIVLFNLAGASKRQEAQVVEIKQHERLVYFKAKVDNKKARNLGKAGQFYLIKYKGGNFHPFSAFSISDDEVSFLIREQGPFTTQLAHDLQINDKLVLEGPYGAFEPKLEHNNTLFVARGVGIAPFAASICAMAQEGKSLEGLSLALINRADDATLLYLKDELAKLSSLGCDIHYFNSHRDDKLLALIKDGSFDKIYYCGDGVLGKKLSKLYQKSGGHSSNFVSEYSKWRLSYN